MKVNISKEADNILELKDDGLYVPKPKETDISGKADKVAGATGGQLRRPGRQRQSDRFR